MIVHQGGKALEEVDQWRAGDPVLILIGKKGREKVTMRARCLLEMAEVQLKNE